MDMREFRSQVYSQDFQHPEDEATCDVQWKGTDVCMDVVCRCGHDFHMDGFHMHYIECAACGQRYALGTHVRLILLNEEQSSSYEVNEQIKRGED